MSIEMSRIMAHIVVTGITLMALGIVGATLVAFTRIVFCGVRKLQKNETDHTFSVGSIVVPKPERRLPSRRVYKKTKEPMAIRSGTQMIPEWSPSLTRDEEKSLVMPTFLRNQKAAISREAESQSVPQKVATSAQAMMEDLFEKKDIFQLEPGT